MKTKKLLAVLMTAAVLTGTTAATAVSTYAVAPEGVVSVNAPEETRLKYIQLLVEDTTSPLGYKFVSTEIEKAFTTAYNITADEVIRKLFDEAEQVENANAAVGAIHQSVQLSAALEAVRNMAGIEFTGSFAPDDMGLYMIIAEKEGWTFNPMAVYVGPDFAGVDVTAKGSEDQVKKTVDEDGAVVSKGDILTYAITAEYPYYPANATDTKFVIKDKVENATLNEDVTIAGFEAGKDYTVTYNDDKTEMTITFTYDRTKAGQEVNVGYTVTVGDISTDDGQIVKNTAISETEKGYTVAEVNSDSATFTINKIDEQDRPLAGAEFTLYVADEKGDITLNYKDAEVKVKAVQTKTTLEADDQSTAFVEVKGQVTFFGLDPDKTYYVKETKAPNGYSLLEEVYLLEGATKKVDEQISSTETDEQGVTYTKLTTTVDVTDYNPETIKNTKLSSLPSTGGIGTTIFTIGGCVIMITAAGLYFATRKKEEK